MQNCKFCHSSNLVKNGKPKGLQRYYCKDCEREQIKGDRRHNHSNEIKKAAIVLYLEGNGLRGTARCLGKIFKSEISFQIVSHWINSAGNIVRSEVAKRQKENPSDRQELAVVELDELSTPTSKKTS